VPASAPYRRRSARVLLVDRADRVLLLHFRDRGRLIWITPGGGVRDGEPLADAAARELREEVGLEVAAGQLRGPVAHSAGYAAFDWAEGVFRDDFFLLRVDAHEIDTSGMEALEAGQHAGHRWWSVAELRDTAETVYPLGLAALLDDLVAGRVPAAPVELAWHHPAPADQGS
jgi:8-oxo-dGTP pyrophosphatase MutT (NUDIX family)